MPNSSLSKARLRALLRLCWLLTLALLFLFQAAAAFGKQDDAERRRAFQLYKDAKYTEALPLFEKLEKAYPNDPEVLERYGFLMISQTAILKDPAARKEARKRARELFLRAEKAGATNVVMKSWIEVIPVDGGADGSFSTKKEVDEAMKEAEAAFVKGDFTKALEMYQQALLFDPNLYAAALFTGDVYYKSAEQRKAGEWFARAIAIDPNRETAYRYWGDSLMKQGRVTEAGDKFVEAFIAEPYNRLARSGILQWAEKINVQLAHPKVDIPVSVTAGQGGNTTIKQDPSSLKNDDKSGSGAAWMTYGLIRASWVSNEFAKQYPTEKTYRHSLKEEATAIRTALKVLSEQKNIDPQAIDPSLQVLAKLEKEGFLESFILLAMPDQGIAQDFAAYRRENVDKLRRYVVEYVLTGGVGKN
ncbi:MAG TPA: tetratricopeptide repeat protein [Pyrinomonadaceae bacterium]|jgi:tetratricopeptide (TPR) repeat protein|nr:tetratricopeptide repeat protein [Pyrinomonadaceae bacterium]